MITGDRRVILSEYIASCELVLVYRVILLLSATTGDRRVVLRDYLALYERVLVRRVILRVYPPGRRASERCGAVTRWAGPRWLRGFLGQRRRVFLAPECARRAI